MLINVELNEDISTMWFLRDQNHDVHLTFMKKGPATINFDLLSENDKDYLYYSISNGFVNPVDGSTLEEITSHYLNMKKKKEERIISEAPKEVVQYKNKLQQTELQRKAAEADLRRLKHSSKREEKFRLMLEGSHLAAKSGISKENDLHNLIALLSLEKAGKNRKQVRDLLEKKIRATKKKLMKKVNESTALSKLTEEEKGMIGEIETSENEYIEFQLTGIE